MLGIVNIFEESQTIIQNQEIPTPKQGFLFLRAILIFFQTLKSKALTLSVSDFVE